MNIDIKDFDNNSFIYPQEVGVYSAREFQYYNFTNKRYAVSSYYKDGKEGIMTVDQTCSLHPIDSSYAFKPISIYYNNKKYLFWSEFKSGWRVESDFPIPLPNIDGNLFANSTVIDSKNNIYIVCEHLYGYMHSDILLFKFDGISWSLSNKLNSPDTFCQRPKIAVYEDSVSIMWDGYNNGYKIYLRSLTNGIWSDLFVVSNPNSWDIKPSLAYAPNGILWFAWLSSADVENNGVVSKRNSVYMASYDGVQIKNIPGNDSPEVLNLNLGLLPAKRYFGYHGLRRNPQIACFENGSIGLFWESQRDETENWENVENGWFLCKIYNGVWGKTSIIQDGGNCFTIDTSSIITDTLYYAHRGKREPITDIKLAFLSVKNLTTFTLPSYSEWNTWKPLKEKAINKSNGIYWGDLHCHSIYSPDAEGYPDELFFYARDIAKIGFCAITDNDIYGDNILTASALRYIWTLCNMFSKDGCFQAFAGYEWTYHQPDLDEPDNFNHRTIVLLDDNLPIASRANNSGFNEDAFVRTLQDSKTMWHAHHGIWNILDPNHDFNVEVVSAWTNNMENFDTVHEQLNKGYKFGFMGASDNHRFIPGNGGALTGVYLNRLTKEDLKSAFINRQNYATCGTRTQLHVSVNNALMGSSIKPTDEQLFLNVHLISDKEIDYIEIVNTGQSLIKVDTIGKEYSSKIELPNSESKRYFYVKVKLVGTDIDFEHNLSLSEGNYIYSSPIWVEGSGNS